MAFEASATWQEYCDIFHGRWGLSKSECNDIGLLGKKLFAAEYRERGPAVYKESVVLPIRNARYACGMLEQRWKFIKTMRPQSPILDYGCGVGATLLFLARLGYTGLYGYELPGIQHSIMELAFANHNISVWRGESVKTVICTNVLEHVEHPVELLNRLYGIGDLIIANICTDKHDSPHIAPESELEECRKMLKASGSLYEIA